MYVFENNYMPAEKITGVIFKKLSRAFIMDKWIFLKYVTSAQKISCVPLSGLVSWSKFNIPRGYFLHISPFKKVPVIFLGARGIFFLIYYPYFNIIGKNRQIFSSPSSRPKSTLKIFLGNNCFRRYFSIKFSRVRKK